MGQEKPPDSLYSHSLCRERLQTRRHRWVAKLESDLKCGMSQDEVQAMMRI